LTITLPITHDSVSLSSLQLEHHTRQQAGIGRLAQNSTLKFNSSSYVVKCVEPADYVNPTRVQAAPKEETMRYRRDYQGQPGLRFNTPGLVGQPLPGQDHRYGIATKSSATAADAMEYQKQTNLQAHLQAQKESTYASTRREPLGRVYGHGQVLPDKTKTPDFRFGTHTSFSESAKAVMYQVGSSVSRPLSVKHYLPLPFPTTKYSPHSLFYSFVSFRFFTSPYRQSARTR
jgi:hypothetical protein